MTLGEIDAFRYFRGISCCVFECDASEELNYFELVEP